MVDEIKKLCKKNNTNIKQLEKNLEIANGSIRKWDEKFPSYDKVLKVANHFNITIEELLNYNKDEKEKDLLMFYRKADNRGKDRIYKTAKDEAEQAEQLLNQKDNISEFPEENKPFA